MAYSLSFLPNLGIEPDIKWKLRAGDKLNFLFKLSDSHGNPGANPLPEFIMYSERGHSDVRMNYRWVDVEQGVLELYSEDLDNAGNYNLCMEGHSTRHSLKVSAADVAPNRCEVTGEGLSNSYVHKKVFKIMLKDTYGNAVKPTAKMCSSSLNITASLPDLVVSKKIEKNSIVCSYQTPENFRTNFQIEVSSIYSKLSDVV